jgi:hypothetical protein
MGTSLSLSAGVVAAVGAEHGRSCKQIRNAEHPTSGQEVGHMKALMVKAVNNVRAVNHKPYLREQSTHSEGSRQWLQPISTSTLLKTIGAN